MGVEEKWRGDITDSRSIALGLLREKFSAATLDKAKGAEVLV